MFSATGWGWTFPTNVAGTQTVIGNTDLTLSRGNKVHDNNQTGIFANASGTGTILIAGNTVNGQRASAFGQAIQAGFGTQVLPTSSSIIRRGSPSTALHRCANSCFGNLNTGITADFGSQVTGNVVYDNPIGIVATASTALIANNLIYDNATVGLKLSQGNGADVVNNTIYAVAGIGLRAEASVQNLELRNNIVWATGGTGVSIANDSQTGLLSDFNLLFANGTGIVGNWLGTNQTTLQQWQLATGKDVNSLTGDPRFVNLDGADNVLGFVLGGPDGSDDDFHLQSTFGSVHGGSLGRCAAAQRVCPCSR